jgi:hypothetical protein
LKLFRFSSRFARGLLPEPVSGCGSIRGAVFEIVLALGGYRMVNLRTAR